MKIRVHYEVNGVDDTVDFEGETMDGIREKITAFMSTRGLNTEKNNMWSEERK